MWMLSKAAATSLAVLALGWASPALADTIGGFTEANVKEIITAAGGTDISVNKLEKDGTTYLKFGRAGSTYLAFLQVCGEAGAPGCLALQVGTSFGGRAFPLETINSFNADYAVGKAFVLPSGTLVSQRFIIVEHGVARENVVVQIGALFAVTDRMIEYINSRNVVMAKPPANTATLSQTKSGPGAAYVAGSPANFDGPPLNTLK